MESEEEETSIAQGNAEVIHALSRKYSQKSVEVAMQNSQSITRMTSVNEPPNTTASTGEDIQGAPVGQQVDASSSHTTNGHNAEHSSMSMPPNSAKGWFSKVASKLPLGYPSRHRRDEVLCLPPGVRIPQKTSTPVRVEPKVFFANERTYFSWMTFAVLLGSFSVALVNTGDKIGKIAGLMYTMISLSTLIYGYGLYYRRHELIMARASGPYGKYFMPTLYHSECCSKFRCFVSFSHHLDDVVGPTVICFALLIAVAINAYCKFTIQVVHTADLIFDFIDGQLNYFSSSI